MEIADRSCVTYALVEVLWPLVSLPSERVLC